MKWMIVSAVLAVVALSVQGGGGGGGWGSSEEFGYGGGSCICVAPKAASRGSRGGRSGTCTGNNGTISFGCLSANKFITCADETCSVQTCPTQQLWNQTAKACVSCATGKHVAANNQTCVCNQGTTWNHTARACSDCPSGATVQADDCFCPSATLLDWKNNACKACPTGSSILRGSGECVCNKVTPTLYWNQAAWACQPCPGTVQNVTQGTGRRAITYSICNCTGQNQIFNLRSVSCYTCPIATTTVSRDGSSCVCNLNRQEFNWKTGACQCVWGFALNAAGTACVAAPRAAASTTAAPLSP